MRYLCIGNDAIRAEWLPRWYKVPHKDCKFLHEREVHKDFEYPMIDMILEPRPNKDYEQHLKTLKTERLLDGNDVR